MIASLFGVRGRSSRLSYALLTLASLALILLSLAVYAVPFVLLLPMEPIARIAGYPVFPNMVAAFLILCAAFWSAVATSARRLHDLGYSGWWMLLMLAPLKELAMFAFVWLMLLLSFFPGMRGANRYGEMPVRDGLDRGTESA